MQSNSREHRQSLGCGYEPAPDPALIPVLPWTHSGAKGDVPTVCVGYTTNLPQVIEVLFARIHWSKGSIAAFTQDPVSEQMAYGIAVMEGQANCVDRWLSTPSEKGGGGA